MLYPHVNTIAFVFYVNLYGASETKLLNKQNIFFCISEDLINIKL